MPVRLSHCSDQVLVQFVEPIYTDVDVDDDGENDVHDHRDDDDDEDEDGYLLIRWTICLRRRWFSSSFSTLCKTCKYKSTSTSAPVNHLHSLYDTQVILEYQI